MTELLSDLPIRGFASCGVAQGWFVEEKHPKTVFVPSAFAMPSCFGILAKGDSMIPAGIESGDLCIVDSGRPVECGKPVMVRAGFPYFLIKSFTISVMTDRSFSSDFRTF